MSQWMLYSLVAIALWGVVGLLQKLGTNRVSADSLLIWMMAGYVLLLPVLLPQCNFGPFRSKELGIAVLVGLTNGLGAWALFLSLERGAKASVAIPLTALYPVVTIVLALVFLGERPSLLHWAGIVLALAGGVLISYETPKADGVRS